MVRRALVPRAALRSAVAAALAGGLLAALPAGSALAARAEDPPAATVTAVTSVQPAATTTVPAAPLSPVFSTRTGPLAASIRAMPALVTDANATQLFSPPDPVLLGHGADLLVQALVRAGRAGRSANVTLPIFATQEAGAWVFVYYIPFCAAVDGPCPLPTVNPWQGFRLTQEVKDDGGSWVAQLSGNMKASLFGRPKGSRPAVPQIFIVASVGTQVAARSQVALSVPLAHAAGAGTYLVVVQLGAVLDKKMWTLVRLRPQIVVAADVARARKG